MWNAIRTARAVIPNRGTVAKVKNHPVTQVAGTVVSTTANVAGKVAMKTVIPAGLAGLGYVQRQVDPDGRYDAEVDAIATGVRHGVGYLGDRIIAVQNALAPDLNHPSVNGQQAIPCDTESVEMFDDDDNLAYPSRQTDVLGTYAARKSTPYAKSDDGLEEVSLYTTKEIKEDLEGRVTVKGGLGDGEAWEMVGEDDMIDEQTEHFYNERLAESTVSASPDRRRDSSATDLEFPTENLTEAEVEFNDEMERLATTIRWRRHEAERAERGEETRPLDQLMEDGGFLPSARFMHADMDAGRRDRELELEREKGKYAGPNEVIPGGSSNIQDGDSEEDISFHPSAARSIPAPAPVKATPFDDISSEESAGEVVPAVPKQMAQQMSASHVRNEAKVVVKEKGAATRKQQAAVHEQDEEDYLSEDESMSELLARQLAVTQPHLEN